MKDKTGRDLSVGDIVEVLADGMLRAVVVKIQEAGAIIEDGRPRPAVLVIQCGVPFELNPGEEAPVYLIRKGKPPEFADVSKKKGRAN